MVEREEQRAASLRNGCAVHRPRRINDENTLARLGGDVRRISSRRGQHRQQISVVSNSLFKHCTIRLARLGGSPFQHEVAISRNDALREPNLHTVLINHSLSNIVIGARHFGEVKSSIEFYVHGDGQAHILNGFLRGVHKGRADGFAVKNRIKDDIL